jgi:hypothetical protein
VALGRGKPKQTRRERLEFRRHLEMLEPLLDESLRDLGARAVEMYNRDGFRADVLWARAAEVAAIEDEANLVRHAISERLTRDQLAELAEQRG